MTKLLLSSSPLRASKYMRKRRILIGLSLLKLITTMGEKITFPGEAGEKRRQVPFSQVVTGGTGVNGLTHCCTFQQTLQQQSTLTISSLFIFSSSIYNQVESYTSNERELNKLSETNFFPRETHNILK